MENKGKIALITGGSRGLGRDMAYKLAEKGIGVIITYNTNEQEAQKVVTTIKDSGVLAASLQLDAGNIGSFAGFTENLKAILSTAFNAEKVDFLVNNAGIGKNAPIGQITETMFDELMNIHFKGVLFLTQNLLPVLNDGGGIINISSGLARFSIPGSATYASMKGAIEVFTRYLAKELGPRGIRANVVAPGAILTEFNDSHLAKNEQMIKVVSANTALGRPGQADDIGGVVAFLCSEDAKWVNAQRIEVSGGMML